MNKYLEKIALDPALGAMIAGGVGIGGGVGYALSKATGRKHPVVGAATGALLGPLGWTHAVLGKKKVELEKTALSPEAALAIRLASIPAFAGGSYALSKHNDRASPVTGAVLGGLFGPFGLLHSVMGKSKGEAEWKARRQLERLREKVKSSG